jgi:hypothetical protein
MLREDDGSYAISSGALLRTLLCSGAMIHLTHGAGDLLHEAQCYGRRNEVPWRPGTCAITSADTMQRQTLIHSA